MLAKHRWYDDPTSLGGIYDWAVQMDLRGTGPYRWDQLDPVVFPDETQEMWSTIAAVVQGQR